MTLKIKARSDWRVLGMERIPVLGACMRMTTKYAKSLVYACQQDMHGVLVLGWKLCKT